MYRRLIAFNRQIDLSQFVETAVILVEHIAVFRSLLGFAGLRACAAVGSFKVRTFAGTQTKLRNLHGKNLFLFKCELDNLAVKCGNLVKKLFLVNNRLAEAQTS